MKDKNFKRVIIITVAILSFSQVSMAQDRRLLALQDAIGMSIGNSKQLKASKARIDIALAQVKEAEDNRLPNFSLSSAYLRLNRPTIDLKTKSTSTTGGSAPVISSVLYGIANISYPLYEGGRIRYGIESAKYLEEAIRLDAENDKEAVILNTLNAYANLFRAAATIEVVKESLASSRERDSTFSRLEQNGILARNDLLKTELQTSNLELSLLDAENNWRLANINMDLMLGLPENTELIVDTNSVKKEYSLKNMAEYEQLALLNKKDIQAISLRKKATAVAIRSANAEGYPSIALTGGYIAANIPGFLTITNAVNVGVGVQYNLASLWKTNTKLQQAKARQQEISANEELLVDAVRVQVSRDYQNYVLGQKRIEVYQKAFQQAAENFRITKNKYDNSLASVTELLDADVALLQARLNVSLSRADAVLSYYKLLYAAGLLTENTGK